jgi:hypothetical protein
MKPVDQNNEKPKSQLTYHKPQLLVYGDIRHFTLTNYQGIGNYDRTPPLRAFKTAIAP